MATKFTQKDASEFLKPEDERYKTETAYFHNKLSSCAVAHSSSSRSLNSPLIYSFTLPRICFCGWSWITSLR